MFRNGLTSEARRFIFLLVLLALAGITIDAFAELVVIALGLYICRLYLKIFSLAKWVLSRRRRVERTHNLTGIWGEIADDITLIEHRHEKEKQRLQQVIKRVEAMTAALSDAVVLLDRKLITRWWNHTAQDFFELREYDRGRRITNSLREPEFLEYFKQGDFEQALEINSLRHPGIRLQFNLYPFGDGEIMMVVRDITQLYKLEQMRKDFVANVSHELRTPLTVIRGYIETLCDSNKLPKEWQAPLKQMEQQTVRMTSLISDLITLSTLETEERIGAQEEVAIAPLVKSILHDAEALSDEHRTFSSNGDESLVLSGSKKELQSAISNLVVNAVKYSPPNSTIKVKYRVTHLQDVVISVSDNGPGIDPKHIPRLTERFYRIDGGRSRDMGGTGLGLAIVKHVMLRHNGQLKISSKPGRGSRFSLRFPLHRVITAKDLRSDLI